MKILKILFMLMGYLATIFLAFLIGVSYCGYVLSTNEHKAKNAKAAFERYGPDKTKKKTETKCEKVPIGFR